ncbi:hypothetical protein FA95DRAFT_1504797 [Auriscalpium vulgare]|uniref:Uncharacterized protein n=1 Tax=Auriscalpium vulgare TaxID=40419 RepID=A0ACB8R4M4_9AGAM|nr:hypothetical protein FA95DRAFT_1504797 [Auriscalpium vulgare]
MAIVDSKRRILGTLAGRPADDPTWDDSGVDAYETLARARVKLRLSSGQVVHRRGNYPTIATGISFGGGQTQPSPLALHGNDDVIQEIKARPSVRRFAGFMNSTFAFGSPKHYKEYERNMQDLLDHDPSLKLPYDNSIWAATTFNFGPEVYTKIHVDSANYPCGWCSIVALGDFNPKYGGQLILHKARLIIEFPPHSVINILSAVFPHGNISIGQHETRASITQYTAGGIFRWNAYGHRTEARFEAEDPEGKAHMDRNRRQRWRDAVNLFSIYDELGKDIQDAFGIES